MRETDAGQMRLNAGLDRQNRRERRRPSSGVSGQVGAGIGPVTNCVFELINKNIILLLQFNWLYQGPRPTGAICRLAMPFTGVVSLSGNMFH